MGIKFFSLCLALLLGHMNSTCGLNAIFVENVTKLQKRLHPPDSYDYLCMIGTLLCYNVLSFSQNNKHQSEIEGFLQRFKPKSFIHFSGLNQHFIKPILTQAERCFSETTHSMINSLVYSTSNMHLFSSKEEEIMAFEKRLNQSPGKLIEQIAHNAYVNYIYMHITYIAEKIGGFKKEISLPQDTLPSSPTPPKEQRISNTSLFNNISFIEDYERKDN